MACEFLQRCGNLANYYIRVTYLLTLLLLAGGTATNFAAVAHAGANRWTDRRPNGQKDERPTDAYYAGSAKMANQKIQLLSVYVKCILFKK